MARRERTLILLLLLLLLSLWPLFGLTLPDAFERCSVGEVQQRCRGLGGVATDWRKSGCRALPCPGLR